MGKSNAKRFLDTFVLLENHLKIKNNNYEYVPFTKQVIDLSRRNNILKRYKDDLLELAELRNAIVHNRADEIYAIAEPHDSTVEKIIIIYKEITTPPLIFPKFKKDVHVFYETTTLSEALKVISKKGFSQFPVYNSRGYFNGLITSKGITGWLAANVENDIFSLKETLISEVIKYQQDKPYEFLAIDATVYDAEELFKRAATKGKELSAILITETGKKTEPLIGLISIWDMVEED